jgi:hypothetical protein
MQQLFSIVIFCIVLFVYLHVQFHLKTSNDLEVYEIEHLVNDKTIFEEICDSRQPVVFNFSNDNIIKNINMNNALSNYGAFDIKIRNTFDTNYETDIYMPLKLNTAIKLFEKDSEKKFYSEQNADFLNETGLNKEFQYNDSFLRPYMVSNCQYDLLAGSEHVCTPFRYELSYRNFYVVTAGTVTIKLSAPKNGKYLNPVYDYENFEFRTDVSPWSDKAEFDKIKYLEVILSVGQTIYIPAYWWYSIKFEKDSSIANFKYNTYMNNIAILPTYGMYILQLQNVKRENNKKLA